jgi:hypothetical protein
VGRKHGAAVFLDDDAPFFTVLPQRKKMHGRSSPFSAVVDLGVSPEFDPVDALQLIFPDADPQVPTVRPSPFLRLISLLYFR